MQNSTSMPTASRRRSRPFSLPLAFVVSLLLHGFLWLVTLWFPFGSVATPAENSIDDIVFNFAPLEEESLLKVVDTSDLDIEDSSFDTDTLRGSPAPGADFLPTPATRGGAVEQQPAQEPLPIPQREEIPPEELQQEPELKPTSTLDESPDAELLRRLEQDLRPPPIDFNRAVREFEKQVQAVREQQQPLGPPGKKPSNVFVPDVSAVENTGYGLGNLVFESTDYDWEDYGRQIYWAIWQAWHNRIYATTDEFELWGRQNGTTILEDELQIRFTIIASGEVVGITLEVPSACHPLDLSAADALAEVILPPLPAEFPRTQETVHARFVAFADLPQMRRYLRAMKEHGIF